MPPMPTNPHEREAAITGAWSPRMHQLMETWSAALSQVYNAGVTYCDGPGEGRGRRSTDHDGRAGVAISSES